MAIELGSSRWSEQVNVIIVGAVGGQPRGDASLDILDRVRVVAGAVELLPELRHIAAERAVMLDAVGLDRTSDARFSISGDGWDLTVVICSSAAVLANPNAANELTALAGDGSHGLAVVCGGASSVRTNWHMNVGHGPTTIDVVGGCRLDALATSRR